MVSEHGGYIPARASPITPGKTERSGEKKDDLRLEEYNNSVGDAGATVVELQVPDEEGDEERNDPDDLAKDTSSLPKPGCMEVLAISRPEWPWLIVGVLFTFIALACDMAKVVVYSTAFDTVVVARSATDDAKGTPEYSLTDLMAAHLILEGVQHAFGQISFLLYELTGERSMARLRHDLFGAILAQEIGLFDRRKSGEFVSRLGTDVATIRGAVSHELAGFLYNFLKFFISIFLFNYMTRDAFRGSSKPPQVNATSGAPVEAVDPWLRHTLIGGSSTIWWITFFWFTRAIAKVSAKYQDVVAKVASLAQEAIGSLRTVRSFAAEEHQCVLYTELAGVPSKCGPCSPCAEGSALAVGVQRTWIRFLGEGLLKSMPGVFLISLNYWGFEGVSHGAMKPGELIGAMIYTLHFAGALVAMITGYGRMVEARGASARIFELLHREPRTMGGQMRPELRGTLHFEDVSFQYPTRPDVTVLRNVSLDVPQGMTTAIVGASGAGKSTLLELVMRFYELKENSGSVRYDNHNLLDLDPVWLRRHIAMVQQEPVLFAMTIRENIAYSQAAAGQPDVKEEAIIAASQQAHAHEFVSAFPDGYNTLVGERGVRLSGGQKQRIALARAILVDPQVLLLDEATSALDATSEVLVQQALDQMMIGRTVMMVAHRLSTVRNADQIVMLQKGAIEDIGTHEELLTKCAAYRTLVSRQLEPADAPLHCA